jgi:uncharacterized protein (TIGR02246 family)
MPKYVISAVTLLILACFDTAGAAESAPAPDTAAEEQAIHHTLEGFTNAFNRGDAAGMSQAFTAQAEFIDEEGTGLQGREAIRQLFEQYFAENQGAKLQLVLDGIRLVTPQVALEDGESTVTIVEKDLQTVRRYAAVFAKEGDKWLLASLREFPQADEFPTASEQLKALEWIIGDWVDESGDAVVATSCRWSDDGNYLLRDFNVKLAGQDALSGTQRIGVDPLTGRIKGWVFDSQGGHGETCWTANGDQWLVSATGVTADGEEASSTYLLKPQGKDRVLFKAMNRVVGQQVEPDIEVTLVRKPPAPADASGTSQPAKTLAR